MTTRHPMLSRRHLLQGAGVLGAAALAPVSLTACGGSTGSPGSATLRFMFWGSDDRVRRFQEACTAFNEANPDITVSPEFGEISSIRTKTTVGMAGGNLPDVFWVLGDLLPQLAADGHLVDLGPHLGQEISTDGFGEALMLPGQIDGTQYAMVHGLQSIGVFAKRSELDGLGIPAPTYPESYTWDEYAQYTTEIHRARGADFFGTDDPNPTGAGNFFRAFARQNGQQMWSETGDVGFTEDLLTDWLTYWEQLRAAQASIPTALMLEQDPFFEGSGLIRGLAAYHMRNSNQMLELQGLTPDPLILMPAPGNGGDGVKNIALDPNMLAVSAKSRFPEAALRFADYLLNDQRRAEIIGTTIGGPPTQRIREAIAPSVSEPERLFLDYIGFESEAETLPVPQALPTAGAFQSGMTQAFETLAYGRASVEQTVATIFGDLRSQLTAS